MTAPRAGGELVVEASADEFGAVLLTVRRAFAVEPRRLVSVVLTPDEAERLAVELLDAAADAFDGRDRILRNRVGLA